MHDLKWRVPLLAGALALAAAAPASAQYQPPPPEEGFEYIFDGTQASFDRWQDVNGAAFTLETAPGPNQGAMNPGTSGFGMRWYPVEQLGDVVLKLDYMDGGDPNGPASSNGGVMVRFPDPRVPFAERPLSYTYDWLGQDGPVPPPDTYTGTYCGRPGPNDVGHANGSNANAHEHWYSVFCGHEVQVNDTLQGVADGKKTGSLYNFGDLNAKQSRTNERTVKGTWHTMEIRMVGQQFTVLVDGKVINQFDNAIPKVASRGFDPPTQARQFPAGYVGLQSHGGSDRVFYRLIRVKDLSTAAVPENTKAPNVTGSGELGDPLKCHSGKWENEGDLDFAWFRSNAIDPSHPRYRAPTQQDLGNVTAPAEPDKYGPGALPFAGSLQVGSGDRYVPAADDVGKVVHCRVTATNDGATVWETATAPEIR
jgi:hypothetical protein